MRSASTGRIVEVHDEGNNRIGLVEFDGKRRAIYLQLVPEAKVGDCVRFHAGFATELVEASRSECPEASVAGTRGEHRDLLTGHPYRLLSELDPEQLRKLLPIAQEKQLAAGEIIFLSGDQSSFLHLIGSGEVALEEVSGEYPVLVQTLHPGDAMGWSALTPGAKTHFQARALSPVSTVAFPGDRLRAVCDADPAVGYALMKRLIELVSERLDALRIKLSELNPPPAEPQKAEDRP